MLKILLDIKIFSLTFTNFFNFIEVNFGELARCTDEFNGAQLKVSLF